MREEEVKKFKEKADAFLDTATTLRREDMILLLMLSRQSSVEQAVQLYVKAT